ncbi:MAG TPA: T9SS type A sorting domain-containing protein [Chitinophagales bacterium]|nr:T9SS type A sorting domain-containing protein [Chitinophagales bacterium]
MNKLLTLFCFTCLSFIAVAQITVTPNNHCAGGNSFQVTITGITQGQVPSSTCGNVTTGGVTNGTGTVVISASGISAPATTMTANVTVPPGQAAGTYGFKLTFGCGSTVSCTNCFTVNRPPTAVSVSPAGPISICQGSSTTLTCNATNAVSYQWRESGNIINNATSATYSAAAAGVYSCDAINTCGSTLSSNSVTVTLKPTPTVTAGVLEDTICAGDVAYVYSVADISSGFVATYTWNTGLVGNVTAENIYPTASTTYVVTVSSDLNCTATATTSITVNAVPSLSPSATPATICNGANSTLAANATAGSGTISSYVWDSGLAGNTAGGSVSPASTTTYVVTVTNSNNCSASANVSVNVNAQPVINPNATPPSVCPGGTTTLAANATAGSGTITTYAWGSGPVGNVSGGSVSPNVATSYNVTVTNSNLCTASASVNVGINSVPVIGLTATPQAICNGGSSLLESNASAGSGTITSINWSTALPQNLPAGQVSPSSTTNYTVTVTNSNNCSTTAGITVNVGATPAAAPTATATPICAGEPTTLAANATAGSGTITTYAWSAGIAGNQSGGSVSPATATTYTVTVTNSDNCTATGSVSIAVNAVPVVGLTATPQAICNGGSSLLESNATAGSGTINSITWSSALPQNSPSGQVSPSSATSYSVTVTNSNNCSTTASTTVSVGSTPTVTATASATTTCAGEISTLETNATAGSGTISTYAWSSGLSGNVTGGDVAPTSTTTYTVTVTNSDNCTATADVTVNVNALPVVSPTAAVTAICAGQSTDLAANATAGSGIISLYAWSEGITGNNAAGTVSPISTTTYIVTVTNTNNCTATGSVDVTINDNPTLSPTALPGIVCEGEITILAANAVTATGTITSYAWSSGLVGNIDGGNVTPAMSTTYTVTATNSFNCTATGTTSVSVTPLPTLASSFGTTFCQGDTSVITINNSYDGYAWSTGDTTASIQAFASGTYTVTVSAVCGTMTSTGLVVSVSDPGMPTITENMVSGMTAHSATAVSYEWFLNGSSIGPATADSVLQQAASGTYTVKITDANGCTAESAPFSYVSIGIHETTGNMEVSLIPNPAKNSVIIKTDLAEGFELSLFDINGKQINTIPATGKVLNVDVSKLNAGVYILEVKTTNSHIVKKLVVE